MRSHVSNAARQRGPMPLRGRSYIAFALTPEPPIMDWLAEIDGWLASSQGFFAGRPVVLDLSAVRLTNSGIAHLISELGRRDIRIMGIEGVAAGDLDPNLAAAGERGASRAGRDESGALTTGTAFG